MLGDRSDLPYYPRFRWTKTGCEAYDLVLPEKCSPSYVPQPPGVSQTEDVLMLEEEPPQTSLPSALVPVSPCIVDAVSPYVKPFSPLWLPTFERMIPLRLLGEVGLHCYNLQNGTNFHLLRVEEGSEDTGIVTSRIRDSTSFFESRVQYSDVKKKRCSTLITTLCRFKPTLQTLEVEDDLCAAFDRLAVDDFFKNDMPNWVPEDISDNLQYYEMKQSDVEEYKEWLRLYAEFAFFTSLEYERCELEWVQPFKLTKIIVQTREDVESKKKAMAENAIFYIAFKTCDPRDYNAIIRRTMDGTPEHMLLETKCWEV